MPIFEYKCEKCELVFEKLARRDETTANCPKCSAANAKKLFSSFAAINGNSPMSKCETAPSCPMVGKSCCSAGTCGMHSK